ncbi:MAG: hypothetical protein VKO64_04590 [Candidatus Sericytochromatia bacterium]|nr:hypothetical protein [Candidatus Sericytochromatia bacterium]
MQAEPHVVVSGPPVQVLEERVGAAPPPAGYPWPVLEFRLPGLVGWRLFVPGRDARGRPVDGWADRLWLVGEGDATGAVGMLGEALGCWDGAVRRTSHSPAEAGLSDAWVEGDRLLHWTEGTEWRIGPLTMFEARYHASGSQGQSSPLSRTMVVVRPWPLPCQSQPSIAQPPP